MEVPRRDARGAGPPPSNLQSSLHLRLSVLSNHLAPASPGAPAAVSVLARNVCTVPCSPRFFASHACSDAPRLLVFTLIDRCLVTQAAAILAWRSTAWHATEAERPELLF